MVYAIQRCRVALYATAHDAHSINMKMFRTVNLDVINECRLYFDFMLWVVGQEKEQLLAEV